MTDRVNVHDAKTHLSRLLEQVETGEEFVIARAGRPVARLIPYHERKSPRVPGVWSGRVEMAADFEATPEDVLRALDS